MPIERAVAARGPSLATRLICLQIRWLFRPPQVLPFVRRLQLQASSLS